MQGNWRTVKKKRLVLKALEATAGNVTEACERAKVGRRTFYEWVEKDPEFKQAYEDIIEGLVDLAESKLIEQIKQGNITAIIFFLKTRGKQRGYVEKSITEHEGGTHIIIEEVDKSQDNTDGNNS